MGTNSEIRRLGVCEFVEDGVTGWTSERRRGPGQVMSTYTDRGLRGEGRSAESGTPTSVKSRSGVWEGLVEGLILVPVRLSCRGRQSLEPKLGVGVVTTQDPGPPGVHRKGNLLS